MLVILPMRCFRPWGFLGKRKPLPTYASLIHANKLCYCPTIKMYNVHGYCRRPRQVTLHVRAPTVMINYRVFTKAYYVRSSPSFNYLCRAHYAWGYLLLLLRSACDQCRFLRRTPPFFDTQPRATAATRQSKDGLSSQPSTLPSPA